MIGEILHYKLSRASNEKIAELFENQWRLTRNELISEIGFFTHMSDIVSNEGGLR